MRSPHAYLAAGNEQTFYTAYLDAVVAGLVQKGLVVRLSGGTHWSTPHTIPDFVWREIRRRRWPAREQPEEEPEDIRSAVRRARAGVSRRPEG